MIDLRKKVAILCLLCISRFLRIFSLVHRILTDTLRQAFEHGIEEGVQASLSCSSDRSLP